MVEMDRRKVFKVYNGENSGVMGELMNIPVILEEF